MKSKVQMTVDTDYFDRRVAEMPGEFEKKLEAVKTDLLKTIEQRFDPTNWDSYTDKIQKFIDATKVRLSRSRIH